MGLIPDEGRVLPPPALLNRGSVQLGILGYVSALLHNGFNRYPVLRAGVHRQILFTTVGVFLGYHMTKLENYKNAKKDRELFDYMKRHPELFAHKEPRRVGEITEAFHPAKARIIPAMFEVLLSRNGTATAPHDFYALVNEYQ
ncbi:PREDICTED: NADH dehydrogenase [ubiquinone] 1 subunit C2-like [Nanorana parkeri]|uniref:NADH dehydrogenase [ubiquinone] 1 subunit C2-like n=1 Tax=Nanorana parkeri TaxID=125878 RepID=UPI0008542421|nr:PREDICTED: NADH dehydrogenase [ubiquinone] 1 subunit C2-like [Nanorana parkeri]